MSDRQKDELRDLRETLLNPNNKVYMLDRSVPSTLQMEYFALVSTRHKNSFFKKVNDLDVEEVKDLLNNPDESERVRKYCICVLAYKYDVQLFRYLQQLQEQKELPEVLDNWLALALLDCQIGIEKELGIPKTQVLVACAMGGKNGKLRFFLLLMAKKEQPFEAYQRKIMKNEIPDTMRRLQIDIERFDIGEQTVEMRLLIPVEELYSDMFKQMIRDMNLYGDFLSEKYIITNTREMSEDEVQIELMNRNRNRIK